MSTTKSGVAIQKKPTSTSGMAHQMTDLLSWSIGAAKDEVPLYWSTHRDKWLCEFVRRPGNDLLAGAIATIVSKIQSANWYIEGPLLKAQLLRQMLLYQSDFGRGWDSLIPKVTFNYLCRDLGGGITKLRASANDKDGPALGYNSLDMSKVYPTGDDTYPLVYLPTNHKIHSSQVAMLTDMPNPEDRFLGVGYCGVSRALTTALILLDVVRYKRERLSDLPPAGILFINNLSEKQWKDLLVKYNTRQYNQGNLVWRDVMVALGVDPQFPTSAEMFELSKLPEHYDEKVATEIAIYSFALAFREDPREFWPVSSGALGTATETVIQHEKAKAKTEGLLFTSLERAFNHPTALPDDCRFGFDFQEDEDDLRSFEIRNEKVNVIKRLYDSISTRTPGVERIASPEGIPDDDVLNDERETSQDEELNPNVVVESEEVNSSSIITRDEARKLLVAWNVVPPDILGITPTIDAVYDNEMTRTLYGPRIRLYRNGDARIL